MARHKLYYCWKCERDMPLLTESEWQIMFPLLEKSFKEIKDYRQTRSVDLPTARDAFKTQAAIKFEVITGVEDVHAEQIYHHRAIDWGHECPQCGHLFRTPQASYCAHCGHNK